MTMGFRFSCVGKSGIYLLLCVAVFSRPAVTKRQPQDEAHAVSRNSPVDPSNSGKTADAPASTAHTKHLRADVDLVLVPTMVADVTNRPVTTLQKENFLVYEDGEPQPIRAFSKEDGPISVGMLLDVSASMSNKFEYERAAVKQFFKNANPQDDYFVIAFSDHPRLIADSTQSFDDLQEKLGLAVPSGRTALLDAICLGVAEMRSAQYQRRALLIISDGGDNHSRYNSGEIKKLVQEADVLIYSIGIFDSLPVPVFKTLEEKLGKHLLTEITEASGGRTLAADDRHRIPELAAAVSRELRQQYVLAYRSSNATHDGKWRKIKVRVTEPSAPRQLHLYYKKGYIAPAD
jgi:Ca-activated chloride channel homolog